MKNKKNNYKIIKSEKIITRNNAYFTVSLTIFDEQHPFIFIGGKKGYLNIPVEDIEKLFNLCLELSKAK